MKNFFLVFLLVCVIVSSYSQSGINRSYTGPAINSVDQDAFTAVNSRGSWRPVVNNYTVDGSPLAFENGEKKLKIFTNDGGVYVVPDGNYNAQTDKVVSVFGKDSIYTFGENNIKKFQFGKDVLVRYADKKGKKRFYFNLSKPNKLTLLKGYFAKIKAGTVNVMTKTKVTNDKYVVVEKYFVLKDDLIVSKISLKKKSILKLMKDHQKEINSFIKDNNIYLKRERDFIRVFNYYNSL
ncbi:MAG: hypothetical protein HRT69_04835 [Flavobacteriaceae bacterium]|nr:hypothetical protein [Flavobacteriaceae bacterium]